MKEEEDLFEQLKALMEEHKKIVQKRRKNNKIRLIGEKTFFGVDIITKKDFIEDLCDRLNNVYNTMMGEKNKGEQLAGLIGAVIGLTNRLNRVCIR